MARRNRKKDIRALIAAAGHLTVREDAISITLTDPARPWWITVIAKNAVLDRAIDDEKFVCLVNRLRPPSPMQQDTPRSTS